MSIRILTGDCLDVLRTLPANSVNCCVTSPPYYGLRDYGTATWEGGDAGCQHRVGNQVQDNKAEGAITSGVRPGVDASHCKVCGARRIDKQIGLEETPEAYVSRLVEVFREVRRVLADDGTLWLNIGDSYSTHAAGKVANPMAKSTLAGVKTQEVANSSSRSQGMYRKDASLPEKNLMGIPWRLAFALQADGWILRQDIIWHKPNPMPESVRDRCTKSHEYVFLLSKSPRYFYDAEAIADPFARSSIPRLQQDVEAQIGTVRANGGAKTNGNFKASGDLGKGTRNRRSVWTITTQPFSEAHFATMAPELAETCIKAGTSEKGCCPHCGSQWSRQVDRKPTVGSNVRASSKVYTGSAYTSPQSAPRGLAKNFGQSSFATLGWQQSCSCPAHEPVPATVLDPFGGAGTTALCADRLGRNALLIELNPAYVEIAKRRLENDAGLFAEVAA